MLSPWFGMTGTGPDLSQLFPQLAKAAETNLRQA